MSELIDKQKFEAELLRRFKKAVNSKKANLVVTSHDSSKGAWGTVKIEGHARLEAYAEKYDFIFSFYSPESAKIIDLCILETKERLK